MTLAHSEMPTPERVRSAAFTPTRLGRRGIDESEVHAFCGWVADGLGMLLNDNNMLQAEIMRLRDRLLEGKGRAGVQPEDAHAQAVQVLSKAQQTADRYVADAQEYSRELAEEARLRRDEILNEANPPRFRQGLTIWFTGLSGSGKSTLANLLEKRLHAQGRHTYVLDGDNVRHGLNRDLGFTEADRVENIRRVAEVAKLMVDAGLIVLVSFISPFRAERRVARALFEPGEFVEVFVDTPLAECERRDPKGLYAKARRGELRNMTGIDSPYEAPESAEVRVATAGMRAEEGVASIMEALQATSVRGSVPG